MSEPLLTYKEIADRLSVSVRKVQYLKEEGTLSHIKLGRSIRFEWEQVQIDLAKSTVKRRAA